MDKLYDIKYEIAKLIAQSKREKEPLKYSDAVHDIISLHTEQATKLLQERYSIMDNNTIQRILNGCKANIPLLQNPISTISNSSISF